MTGVEFTEQGFLRKTSPGRFVPATKPTNTEPLLEQHRQDIQAGMLELGDQVDLDGSEAEPMVLARKFLGEMLPIQALIEFKRLFDESYPKKNTVEFDREFLVGLGLFGSPYLPGLVKRGESLRARGKRADVVEMSPFRPNIHAPMSTGIMLMMFDNSKWIEQFGKEVGGMKKISASKREYGRVMEGWIGGEEVYFLVVRDFKLLDGRIARKKRLGSNAQLLENGKASEEIERKALGYPGGRQVYIDRLKELSLLTIGEVTRFFEFGNLTQAFIDDFDNPYSERSEREKREMIRKCLDKPSLDKFELLVGAEAD